MDIKKTALIPGVVFIYVIIKSFAKISFPEAKEKASILSN